MNVIITSDSTCDLSPELCSRHGIRLLPLAISLGERTGADGVDICPEDIYSYVDSIGMLPKTSATNVSDYVSFFSDQLAQADSVVHFCLGSGFSSTYQNACIAAEELGRVFVVDSANLSTGQGLLVLMGAEMAKEGYPAEQIYTACSEAALRVEASFAIDSLDYLYKGGRCSALAVFGGNLLRLKPCIEVRNGRMLPGKKYRGEIERVILQYVEDRLRNRKDIDRHRIFVTHPERFWEHSNEALRCSNCTDKLCTQYCQKLRKDNNLIS